MLTTRALMGEVAKYGHFVVTDGKNDTNSAGYILSCFSLRTRHGIPYSAFCWIGEEETEGTIFSAGPTYFLYINNSEWKTVVKMILLLEKIYDKLFFNCNMPA